MRRLYIFIVLAAALALTATACSSNRYGRYPYPGDRYERAGYGSNFDRVRELAYELERSTDNLKEQAKHNSYHRSRSEDYLIDRLEDLDDEAEDFRNEVDHNRDPRRTSDDFRDLQKRYYDARNALQGVSGYGAYNYLYRDFDRVNRIMGELSRVYGYGYNSAYRRY